MSDHPYSKWWWLVQMCSCLFPPVLSPGRWWQQRSCWTCLTGSTGRAAASPRTRNPRWPLPSGSRLSRLTSMTDPCLVSWWRIVSLFTHRKTFCKCVATDWCWNVDSFEISASVTLYDLCDASQSYGYSNILWRHTLNVGLAQHLALKCW